ncbi:hypothetical protein VNO80_00841 [Phaseolus coccineus]|uniref:Protein FAR1-RELATED SEQUENCE n=1 Tax=Phaseolus coccineus TaxID=3886 RepID=A0AAN9RRB3_PHACN
MNENNNLSLDDIPMVEGEVSAVGHDTVLDNVEPSVPTVGMCFDSPPTVGMCFDSAKAVKTYYRQYAITKGFGIRIRSSKKGVDNEIRYFMLVCSREGKYVSSIPTEIKTLPTQANECQARITVGRKEGKWYIMSVIDEHSHDLSPTKSRLFCGNRKLKLKRNLEMNGDVGVRINKSFQSLVSAAGGYDSQEFVERDVRNYVGKQRHALGKDGDGKALLSHFLRMRELNKDFFFDIDIDDENRIRNFFWADARSRAACYDFGDIVSFDTTYLINKYDMPFTPFLGVNHHGQYILLGCGLLSSEDTNTFVWLFECWLRCMSYKAPQGIVTDQCNAMKNAISVVFPQTHHRWCLWHIMKQIPEKLQGYGEYKEIKHAMKVVVYETMTVDEFECEWGKFINTFGLMNDEWLGTLYDERHRWVPCYLKNHFWAGMSTTQRSKSMNAFFDGYINSTTTLQQFLHQYDNALQHKAEKEYEADFASLNTVIPCGSQSLIERQFQTEYTHAKFGEVQTEFRGKMNCVVQNVVVNGDVCRYDVMEEFIHNGHSRDRLYIVCYDRDNHNVNCNCLLFEFRGILCRHCLVVLAQERQKQVPAKYVLMRWSKNVRRKHTYIKTSYNITDKEPHIERYDALCKTFSEIAQVACEKPETTELLFQHLHAFATLHALPGPTITQHINGGQLDINALDSTPQSNDASNHTVYPEIRSPVAVQRKGQPRS